jgi:hypothetical protein
VNSGIATGNAKLNIPLHGRYDALAPRRIKSENRAFFEGDMRSHGATQLAEGWRSQGNALRSGVADVQSLLQPHGFRLCEELVPAAMEQRYLSHLPGGPRKVWGVMRMAHAQRFETASEGRYAC